MQSGLNEPEVIENEQRQLEKTFDYEEDMEDFGKKFDKENRVKFSKAECDNIFMTDTDVINDINALKNEQVEDFTEHLEEIKKQAMKEEILFSSEEFDIFGGMSEDKTKISVLGNTKHREIKKSKFRILEINKNTENSQYIKSLNEITESIDKSISKAELGVKLNGYFASTEVLNNEKYNILYINPQNALNVLKKYDKINLYSIKLDEKTKAIPLTNIMYYDNTNATLPLRYEC